MVRGLIPRVEQDQVLATLGKSAVLLTSANIEPLLLGRGGDSPPTEPRALAGLRCRERTWTMRACE